MWNKQRKDEVLIDVEDVALGHTTKLRWNETGKWLWSDKIVHPPIIDRETFDQVQATDRRAALTHAPAQAAPLAATRTRCAAASGAASASGGCRSHWANDVPYYRCRFPAEYALANRVQPPRERLPARRPAHRRGRRLAGPRVRPAPPAKTIVPTWQPPSSPSRRRRRPRAKTALKIAECDRKLSRVPRRLDAGASPATVAAWIAETEAEKAGYLASRGARAPAQAPTDERGRDQGHRRPARRPRARPSDADPNDKSEIFRQLGLKLTYHPGRGLVEAK